MNLKDIYNQLILDHYKNSYNKDKILPDAHSVHSANNNCGDSVTLHFTIEPTGECIEEVSFEAEGCVICQASASVLMQTVEGKNLAETLKIIRTLKQLLSEDLHSEDDTKADTQTNDQGSDFRALSYINAYPTRKQCVLLSWEAMEEKVKELMD